MLLVSQPGTKYCLCVRHGAHTNSEIGNFDNRFYFVKRVDFILHTGQRGHITATQRIVSAIQFSSARLQCSALSWRGCLFGSALTWHYKNGTLQNNTKYVINEQPKYECKHRSLQAEFNLEIFNVTDDDVGKYYCGMKCAFPRLIAKDTIVLLVSQPGTKYCLC